MNCILSKPEDYAELLQEHVTQKERNTLRKEIKDQNIKHVSVECWANRAKLRSFYTHFYKPLCSDVHSVVRSLENHFTKTDGHSIVSVECKPSTQDLKESLCTASRILLCSLTSLCNLFSVDCTNEIEKFEKMYPF